MPSRSVTLAILAFWAATTAWLVWRDVWPRLAPGEPPPFSLTLLDGSRPTVIPGRWRAVRHSPGDDEPARYLINTNVAHEPATDTFELQARMAKLSPPDFPRVLHVDSVTSTYRVARAGANFLRLTGFSAEVDFISPLAPALGRRGSFTGEVRDRVCTLSWQQESTLDRSRGEQQLDVPHNGVVLLPLHPVDQLRGLTPGRRWSVWLVDPVSSTALLSAGPLVVSVSARVLAGTEELSMHGGRRRECRVVEYEGGDNVSGRIWVDASNDQVVKMTFRVEGSDWEITRD